MSWKHIPFSMTNISSTIKLGLRCTPMLKGVEMSARTWPLNNRQEENVVLFKAVAVLTGHLERVKTIGSCLH